MHLVFVILKLNLTFCPILNYLVWNSENIVYLKLEILRLQHAEIFACLFTELANSNVWESPDGLFQHFLQKRSTSLAVFKKKFGSGNADILLSCPETILHDIEF